MALISSGRMETRVGSPRRGIGWEEEGEAERQRGGLAHLGERQAEATNLAGEAGVDHA